MQSALATIAHDQESPVRSTAVMQPETEYPPCFCDPPIPWEERRDDGTWEDLYDVLNDDEPSPMIASRTCMCCGATKSIEVRS